MVAMPRHIPVRILACDDMESRHEGTVLCSVVLDELPKTDDGHAPVCALCALALSHLSARTPRCSEALADAGSPWVGAPVHEVERALILDTLTFTGGNRTHAAGLLGISIRSLRNKLRGYAAAGTPVPPPLAGGH